VENPGGKKGRLKPRKWEKSSYPDCAFLSRNRKTGEKKEVDRAANNYKQSEVNGRKIKGGKKEKWERENA